MLSAGDHIVSCDDIYGGTNRLFQQVTKRSGIELDFVDATNLDNVKNAIKKNTRVSILNKDKENYYLFYHFILFAVDLDRNTNESMHEST